MALFGDVARSRREPRSVVEFRAGKMSMNGTIVSPDKRKGLVFMKMEDNLLHFCWKDRTSGQIEDDFIIFPGDAEIKHITQCKTGRVLLLKFKESNRKFFYWLQEPKEDKDEEYVKKVNDFIENPNSALTASNITDGISDLTRRGFPSGLMAAQLQNFLQGGGGGSSGSGDGVSQQQLLELLALSGSSPLDILMGRGASGRGDSHGSGTANEEPRPQEQLQQQQQQQQQPRHLQLGDLQNALESLQVPPSSVPTPSNQQQQVQEQSEDRLTLRDVVTTDALRPLIRENTDDVNSDLIQHLPPTGESVETALSTPQFQQAMGVFSSALSSGQLGPLVTEFGLSTDVASAAATGSVQRFAEALEEEMKSEDKGQEQEDDNDEEKKDENN